MDDFSPISKDLVLDNEETRPSLTFWKDAWRRLKRNPLAITGLIGVILILFLAIFGPLFSKISYSDQNLDFANVPPRMELYEVEPGYFVYLTNDYKVIHVSSKGVLLERLPDIKKDAIKKIYTYQMPNGKELHLDFSHRLDKSTKLEFTFQVGNGEIIQKPAKKVSNKTYPFGTDVVGRSLLVRVLYGARISLTVAFVASLANLLIGVLFGSIAGYEGGRVDTIMMRFVDLLQSIPLLIYVILIMVVMGNRGLWTMILSLGSVYWTQMARLVRGQVLSLKNQEFVLAAKALGVSRKNIINRHLIPNSIGPILISMTMMIPSAVFTESFISFIGLGVSAPMASWGTLANDALSGLLSYPYQLFYPSLAIAVTMLSFNFLGDGLRDALDPRLRKG